MSLSLSRVLRTSISLMLHNWMLKFHFLMDSVEAHIIMLLYPMVPPQVNPTSLVLTYYKLFHSKLLNLENEEPISSLFLWNLENLSYICTDFSSRRKI